MFELLFGSIEAGAGLGWLLVPVLALALWALALAGIALEFVAGVLACPARGAGGPTRR